MCGGHARFFPPYLRRGLAAENISPTVVSCRQPECIGKAATNLRLQVGCSKQAPVLCWGLRLALRFTCKLKETTRADERTRTADLPSLRVINRALQGFARACKTPISKGFSFSGLPCVAPYCVRDGVRVVSNGPRISHCQLLFKGVFGHLLGNP